jgi:hypothetical protein
MTRQILLFDMDGVLLIPGGYCESLKSSVKRMGLALGMSSVDLTNDQIARFEARSITNEWDTLAICTVLSLLEIWQSDPEVRLNSLVPKKDRLSSQTPAYDDFLDSFTHVGSLPCRSAYEKIIQENPALGESQKSHLREILFNARDIDKSPLLGSHQETVLGSEAFHDHYHLAPQLGIKSYLTEYDQPALTPETKKTLYTWLSDNNHLAGIMTNRPSSTPPGYLSSPEAELGAELIGMRDLPLLGSGMLAWFAVTQCQIPDHVLLKPNPVHALALMQICFGEPVNKALSLAYDLWRGVGHRNDWLKLNHAEILIFEDARKGFESGQTAKALLDQQKIDIDLQLIGISQNPIKRAALQELADQVFSDINEVVWGRL